MEPLKSCIPEDLRKLIVSTPTSQLTISCGALLHHFSSAPQFSQLLEQLMSPDLTSCAKDAVSSVNWKLDGNAAFGSRNYGRALSCYTKALRYAPFTPNEDDDRVSQATLFINRASTLHKLGHLESAMRDCDRAVDLHPAYSKAWYRRAYVKRDLRDFSGAITDMEKALASETTSRSQLQIKRELAQMNLISESTHSSGRTQTSSSSANSGALCQGMELQRTPGRGHLQKHWTKEWGWYLQTKEDLPSGSLVFQEDPYAAVVLKSCRDTHCHFCFVLLPPDPVACSGCAIPLYCSDVCRSRAISRLGGIDTTSKHINSKQPINTCLINGVPLANSTCELSKVQENVGSSHQRWGEHVSECGGASWSAVLPTEAVLGARMLYCTTFMDNGVLMRNFNLARGTGDVSEIMLEVDTLCHHYDHLSPSDKLELHVLGIVTAHCVKRSAVPLQETGIKAAAIAAKLIGLMAQARVNAMAIFRMSSPDFDDDIGNGSCCSSTPQNVVNYSLCTVEQVKVAQGIYLLGSRLNHSCVPNIHASFVLGRLCIHAITNITQGSTLELCYGPQAGKLNQFERRQLLESYFFNCTCPACSKLTLPDLCLRSFRCAKPACMGVVLGPKSLSSRFDGTNSRESIGEGERKNSSVGGYVALKDKGSQHVRQCSTAVIEVDLSVEDKEFAKASLVCKENIGSCLYCGILVDVETADETATSATVHLERVEADLINADTHGKDLKETLTGALKALNSLRATVHAYNEQLAKGEDIVARLFCAQDQPLKALEHCLRSIEILQHLYNKQHIVIGNEHLKLASVALMVPDMKHVRRSLNIVDQIFSVHYGTDYRSRLPYVNRLQEIAQ